MVASSIILSWERWEISGVITPTILFEDMTMLCTREPNTPTLYHLATGVLGSPQPDKTVYHVCKAGKLLYGITCIAGPAISACRGEQRTQRVSLFLRHVVSMLQKWIPCQINLFAVHRHH